MEQMNLSTKENQITDIYNGLVLAKGEEGRRGIDWEFQVSKCKLLHLERISNEVPL